MKEKHLKTSPEYIDIYDLLNQVSHRKFCQEIFFNELISPITLDNGVTRISFPYISDPRVLRSLAREKQFPQHYPAMRIHIDRRHDDHLKPHTYSIKNPYAGGTLLIRSILEANNYSPFFQSCEMIRKWLLEEKLTAWIRFQESWHKLPSSLWLSDNNWYRILADGRINDFIPYIDRQMSINEIVYFDKNSLESLCPTQSIHQAIPFLRHSLPLIHLDIYKTPWLEVFDAIDQCFGEEELVEMRKDDLISFIQDYINNNNLNIATTDIKYLAQFIRPAEKMKGRGFKKESYQKTIPSDLQVSKYSKPLIDLSLRYTPWLDAMNAVYEEFGQEGLLSLSKESIEAYIKENSQKKNLKIGISNIPYLAKFMRQEEQKKGKAFNKLSPVTQ